jgi:uncharacterized protein YkwD
LRSLAAALLAVPTLIRIYAGSVLRRSMAVRLTVVMSLGAIVGIAAIALARPGATTAIPSGVETAPLPPTAFAVAVRTHLPLQAPIVLTFSAPMDRASVRSALAVRPATDVRLSWDPGSTRLTITPADRWLPGAYHVVTVGRAAYDQAGTPLAEPVRSAFLGRPRAVGRVAVEAADLTAVGPRPVLSAMLEGSVDPAALARAVAVEPPLPGHVAVTSGPEPLSPDSSPSWRAVFIPSGPLAPGTTYRLLLAEGLVDVDGAVVETPAPLEFRTAAAPAVVRFRPAGGATGVAVGTEISVRFDQPMDRASTERAFGMSVAKRSVAGSFRWAEGDTVLVFDPAKAFGRAANVGVSIFPGARSKAGFELTTRHTIVFTTVAPVKPATGSTRTGTSGGGSSGGGAVGGGSWAAVESYYLRLLNCTRTGGWVTSSGSCSSPGGSGVAALKLDAGLSSKVARPYAKVLAIKGACGHDADGSLADRLRRGGYGGYYWAGENVGCRSGSPTASVLASHLHFQSEKSYNGAHWRNIMNPVFDRVGIGVWVASGRVRLVTDFYKG